MNFQEIIAQLKEPFSPEAHKERELPGGGRWFYIPWQLIRDRLDEVCPTWQVSWSSPEYVGDFCVIMCSLTIEGITRQAPGNAKILELSSTQTISGEAFKQHPRDVKVIEGAASAIACFAERGYHIVGISNQGGIEKGFKTLAATIEEFEYTMELFPQLHHIYFCPDMAGGNDCTLVSRGELPLEVGFLEEQLVGRYRKPNPGMIELVLLEFQDEGKEIGECWMVGDRLEDKACATAANVNFCPAHIWRKRFTCGVNEIKATLEQFRFLENI